MFSRFRVSGSSMEPNFREGDYVLVNKFAYMFGKLKIGDAVVVEDNGMLILKRIKEIIGSEIRVAGDSEESNKFVTSKNEIVGKILFRIKKIGTQ